MSLPVLIEVEYLIGDTVYLKTDVSQLPALVVGYSVGPGGTVLYEVQQSTTQYRAYALELSTEPDEERREKYA